MKTSISLLGAFVLTAFVASPARAASITAYYPLDSDLVDVVGGNNGISPNETHATILGRTALDTNPVNSHAEVAGSGWAGSATANDQIAFSFWQLDGGASNSSTFWGRDAANGRGAQAHVPWSDGTIYWDTAGCCGGGQRLTTPIGLGNDGNWHHFVFNKNGGVKEIWMDGVLQNSQPSGASVLPSFGDLTLAAQKQPAGGIVDRMTGYLDEMSIWDQALTSAEITQLASGVSPLAVAGIIPEPSTLILTTLGLLSLGMTRRRRRR